MEMKEVVSKTKNILFRFRYPILVIVIGLVLLTFPGKSKTPKSVATQPATPTTQHSTTTQQLIEILQQIKGVGQVKVLLTISKGEKKEYQTDEEHSSNENGSDLRKETVIIRDANDNETALLTQIISPEYLGAIVVCEGADDANVKLAVLEAVSKATGLRSDSISVLKMK